MGLKLCFLTLAGAAALSASNAAAQSWNHTITILDHHWTSYNEQLDQTPTKTHPSYSGPGVGMLYWTNNQGRNVGIIRAESDPDIVYGGLSVQLDDGFSQSTQSVGSSTTWIVSYEHNDNEEDGLIEGQASGTLNSYVTTRFGLCWGRLMAAMLLDTDHTEEIKMEDQVQNSTLAGSMGQFTLSVKPWGVGFDMTLPEVLATQTGTLSGQSTTAAVTLPPTEDDWFELRVHNKVYVEAGGKNAGSVTGDLNGTWTSNWKLSHAGQGPV